MHTYQPILKLLAESMQVGAAPVKDLEGELVLATYRQVQAHKTLYIVIDEAHLLRDSAQPSNPVSAWSTSISSECNREIVQSGLDQPLLAHLSFSRHSLA